MENNLQINSLARRIWDYHHLNHKLEKSDCILVLGSHDLRVAERGAQLFLNGFASILIFSGGLGNLTKGIWNEAEADKFACIAVKMGVPKEKILIENKSENTGENIRFSYEMLKRNGISPKKIILVQKPYMERRTYATFVKQWPNQNVEISVTSPQISFEEYANEVIKIDDVINIMIGDLQRIKEYPQKGFQIFQEIPDDVWKAYEELVNYGFTKHMINNS